MLKDIFDALIKTLPVSWKNQVIVVMDEVFIDPPYTSSSCQIASGKTNANSTLIRVKKVLEGERARLGLKS